jgi:hypothetical protein
MKSFDEDVNYPPIMPASGDKKYLKKERDLSVWALHLQGM